MSHADEPASSPAPGATASAPASFELYDLRVEVVAPPGQRILCGAEAR
jgi:hypothetical protein